MKGFGTNTCIHCSPKPRGSKLEMGGWARRGLVQAPPDGTWNFDGESKHGGCCSASGEVGVSRGCVLVGVGMWVWVLVLHTFEENLKSNGLGKLTLGRKFEIISGGDVLAEVKE